ncbi:uncharacterized protein L3040_008589 [Drepanopeziza brunnea f. sp. 'multigermtubi']|uniref:DUF5672 domain-containing protein n=1 Tax=Marssonina brunnea f. sp. multigermtubi (strain MB_m1) TaxID=1072389 RepID=K1XM43_MARBU|nr:uncharacterized protein MBM_08262 [Drepanopeziza brunnea f. sp. 'multigermtubi' MB_m1]EKD13544.1 hypothetical protein MBM_08262 [Drepanopeziza brunnea f. sp. 'multigermtubi' MB_m1]KAJ5033474.1 hypothetical protein L3040_008589 [Drepanopeziza brunnea f. sp. 'multigermtubi']
MSSSSGDMTIDDVWDYVKAAAIAGWSRTTRRMRAAGGVLLFFIFCLLFLRPSIPETPSFSNLPSVSLHYGTEGPISPFNSSKVALLVENRPNPILPPLVLHFIAVVPPDWRFRVMGSLESIELLNSSRAIRNQVASGKLDLTYIPANMTTGSQEEISRFLTTLWLYETVLQPAEWLLVFQTDSMLCANSRQSLNSWLDYDWVGAPWNPNGRFGGNGGLSLRKVSAIIDVLRNQQRLPDSEPEDVWLTDRLGHRPGAKLANGTMSLTFSGEMFPGKEEKVGSDKKKGKKPPGIDGYNEGELIKGIDDYRDGFYEPMGYHTGGSGDTLHSGIWGTPAMRAHIWSYCPEVKMMLEMDAAKYVPGECHANWKRMEEGWGDMYETYEMGLPATEWIDGEEYPMLPQGLMPW